jgi:hypothetical protein
VHFGKQIITTQIPNICFAIDVLYLHLQILTFVK